MNSQIISQMRSEKINIDVILIIENYCYERIRKNNLSKLRNDVKLRVAKTVKTYEEFKDLVDTAELIPIDKTEKMNSRTKNSLWNTSAS